MELIPLVQDDLNGRVRVLETKVEDHDKKLNAQSEKNETLTRLATLMELQMEEAKEKERRQEIRDDKQNKSMERFGETLLKVNENLTSLNNKQESLGTRVAEIEGTLSEQKIDTFKLVKGILSYIATGLGSIAIAVAIWYLTK
jgi:chromosome segregation ATPase